MLRGIDANNRKNGSEPDNDKYTSEEIGSILINAKEKLPHLVSRYAKEMKVDYNQVFVKAQKTRWGSCSDKGNINLNCLLLIVPSYVRKLVADEMSDYQKAVKWLKKNGEAVIGKL